MALDLLEDFPEVARQTIRRLTSLQGVRDNARAEEEPGRILHEHRRADDLHAARLGLHWDLPYYGSVDATPLYVSLIGHYCQRVSLSLLEERVRDRTGAYVTVRMGLERALAWIERRMARHGYVCVRRSQPDGIQHQVWEDSFDSHFFEDGRLFDAHVPYAPVAVQGQVYDALQVGSQFSADDRQSAHFEALATMIRYKVLEEFWLPGLDTFAPALVLDGPRPTPARIMASSAGHLLASRVLDGNEAASRRTRLVHRLLAPDMLAAAGIRTKSTSVPRFGPGSYHNGSVWPMDTGVIAEGLRRHGHLAEAHDLENRVLRACARFGFAEFFRGDADDEIRVNAVVHHTVVDGQLHRLEQPPQSTQGWTVTRVWRILRQRGLVTVGAPVRLDNAA